MAARIEDARGEDLLVKGTLAERTCDAVDELLFLYGGPAPCAVIVELVDAGIAGLAVRCRLAAGAHAAFPAVAQPADGGAPATRAQRRALAPRAQVRRPRPARTPARGQGAARGR